MKPPDSSDSTAPPSTGSTDPLAVQADALPPSIIARPEYLQALSEEPDRLGRQVPHALSAVKLLAQFSDGQWHGVPGEFWAADVNSEGFSYAAISCVCGATPHVEVLTHAKCPGCYRWFLFGGDRVLVAYGEMPPAAED